MIDKETVDRILDSVNIVDVIGDFVSLRRRGANYIACCPFHNEKTPSFSVSPTKGIFKCFGCGKAGSAVTFIMEHEQMTYVEALKYLAKKYGIEVHEKEESEEEAADRLKRESMLLVSEYAAKVYTENLFGTEAGRAIGMSYFQQRRGFTEETIRKFGLGYAPSSSQFQGGPEHLPSLAERALKEGYKREFLIAAGLCFERGSGQLTDKFHDRVMFPIHSLSGRVIAFGGRTLREDKSVAKYLNSPESEIYHKSRSLYGIFFAKSEISKLQKCYLVEGYTDVISFHQAGITNVVASSGTSLTTDQIRLIRRFTPKVTVLYDGDFAGIKASIRGIDMLLEEGLEVKVVLLPDGEDPDSFARSHTKEEIREFLDGHETDFIEFKYELLSESIEKDPIRKAELIREIVRTISVIPDQITRSVYVEQTASRLGLREDMIFQEVAKNRRKRIESGEYERSRAEEKQQGAPVYRTVEEENVRAIEKEPEGEIPILDPSEKELLYYLLKFGEYLMVFEDHYKVGGDHPVMRISVAQYISAQLRNDDLEFKNPLYARIYRQYFQFREEERASFPAGTELPEEETESLQGKIQQRFIHAGDKEVTQTVLDLIIDEYNLNIREYLKAIIPEKNVISKNVPRSVLVYKLKYTEYVYQQTADSLSDPGKSGDVKNQMELMKQLKMLLQLKNALVKELKRLN